MTDGMDFTDMTSAQIQALIDEAQAALDARAELDHAAQAVHDAVAAYASAAGTTVAEAWAALSPLPVEPSPEPEPVDAPAWEQPAGAHDAYTPGDRVVFEGVVYEAVTGGNVWSPKAYPQGWRKL